MPAKTLTDLDALLIANRRKAPGPRCGVCKALNEVDDDRRRKLLDALADREGFTGAGLAAVFSALGYRMGSSPIDRHRRNECVTHV